jgi:putative hydrolase of the HAD superfamily
VAISIPDRVVVFDYGEVISLPQSHADRAALVAAARVDPEAFWPAYWQHREELDQGRVLVRDYWSRLSAQLGADWTPAEVQQLWVLDVRSWLSVDPGTVQVIAELHAGGTRLALLSNAGFDFTELFRHSPFSAYFDDFFVSAELDLVKPDPAIYQHVADELGIGFGNFVFVDNKAENVDALVALGGTGHVFVGAAELRRFLEGLA